MPTKGAEIHVFEDRDALVKAAAEAVADAIARSVALRGLCRIALSGGSTPRPVLELMASSGKPSQSVWSSAHVFWVDERCVPPDHPDSNYGMACRALLDHVQPAAVHRMRGEADPAQAAADYESLLRECFGARHDAAPVFDVIVLGMGDDGHVASLFPGSDALHEAERLVLAPYVDKLRAHRITLTYPVLNAARDRLVLVSGAAKHPAFTQVFGEDAQLPADPLPASRLQPAAGRTRWFLDRPAAHG